MKNWQRIYHSTDRLAAELAHRRLETAGLRAVLVNKQDSAYGMFGPVEVHVPREEVMQALKTLEDEPDKEN